jgi:hypothetical protein
MGSGTAARSAPLNRRRPGCWFRRLGFAGLAVILITAWLAGAAPSFAASTITFVQANYADPQSPQTSVAVKFNAAQSAGDLSVVVVGWNDSTASVGSVSDSNHNNYTLAVGPTVLAGFGSQSIF